MNDASTPQKSLRDISVKFLQKAYLILKHKPDIDYERYEEFRKFIRNSLFAVSIAFIFSSLDQLGSLEFGNEESVEITPYLDGGIKVLFLLLMVEAISTVLGKNFKILPFIIYILILNYYAYSLGFLTGKYSYTPSPRQKALFEYYSKGHNERIQLEKNLEKISENHFKYDLCNIANMVSQNQILIELTKNEISKLQYLKLNKKLTLNCKSYEQQWGISIKTLKKAMKNEKSKFEKLFGTREERKDQ